MKKSFLILCIFFSLNTVAQSTDLDPVTVTASRSAERTNETGSSISVVDGKYFRQLPVHSIDDLMKYIPGIEVQQRGPAGSQADVVLRGGTFQQVLVLLDGVKINDPVTGHFSSYLPIAPYEIDRIEILRGPAAAIYGSEAVGGVIHIISKNFQKFNPYKSTKGSVAASAGEYGFWNTELGVHHTGKKINIAGGLLSNNADGQLLRGNHRGFFHNNTASLSASASLSTNWRLNFRSALDNRDFAAQNFYTPFASDTATERVKSWWNQLQLKRSDSVKSDEVSFAYKQTSDHYVYNSKSVPNDNRSHFIFFQYTHTGRLYKNVKLNYGIMADDRLIRSNDRGDHATVHGAAFGALRIAVGQLHVNPSLRVDMDENYGMELLPQLNLAYRFKKINFRANAGRAIRAADFTERYNNYGKKLVTGGSIGNPQLEAERSWSYEAGADLLLKQFKFSLTYFIRDQHNLIDYVATPYAQMPRKDNLLPTGIYALAKNISRVQTNGLEMMLAWQYRFSARHDLLLNAGASFIHSASSEPTPSFYIISHARTMLQGNLIYQYKNLQLSLSGIYKQRAGQAASGINASISRDYFIVNAKVQYRFFNCLSAFVSGNNLGNKMYSDLLGSRLPGSWTSVGLRFDFGSPRHGLSFP